ncbi:MAG TPA: hypothetical protein VI320_14960 [Terracidiphilus sp.]|jgi:hypothetical protein
MPAQPWDADFRGERLEMAAQENACMVRPSSDDAWKHPSFLRGRRDLLPPREKRYKVVIERNDIARGFAFYIRNDPIHG